MFSRSHYCPHSDAERTLRGTWCNGLEAELKDLQATSWNSRTRKQEDTITLEWVKEGDDAPCHAQE